jgi:hypothetical protein
MNRVNREEIIEFVRNAISDGKTLSATSFNTLRDMKEKYGKQQYLEDDVNFWFNELKEMNFELHTSRAETDEWFEEWLSKLPV